ncbi:hypothetical protein [Legionella clemsonensis]|nr:hypothetical protein [Legionella clemsonensis]
MELADEQANAKAKAKNNEEASADEIGNELICLIDEALLHISVSQLKLDNLQNLINTLDNQQINAIGVLTAFTGKYTDPDHPAQPVSEEQYRVLASIYEIELDGHRIKEVDEKAGEAAIKLGKKLLNITQTIFEKKSLGEEEENAYKNAYDEAKGQGIEHHRGIKEKFYRFLKVLSCLFIVPAIYHAKNAEKTGSFWGHVKTKTEEDIEKSQEAIEKYKNNQSPS